MIKKGVKPVSFTSSLSLVDVRSKTNGDVSKLFVISTV